MFGFDILAAQGDARFGKISTQRGSIYTPSFVPVGTFAGMGSVFPDELRELGCQVIITNAYHLHLRPGDELIERRGGLHQFMGWDGPLITDSGGFQIFSLGAAKQYGGSKIAPIFSHPIEQSASLRSIKGSPLVRIDEDGVEFVSYLDGSRHRFTPEKVMAIGRRLGTDILMVLDECTSPFHDYRYTNEAMERTHRWATRSLEEFEHIKPSQQAIIGIVQGGAYRDLRRKSARFIGGLNFDGYAIGGSLGKSKEDMYHVLDWTIPLLPDEKPRHLLGIGEVVDIFEIVTKGIDLFDCVFPTMLAKTGTFLIREAERFRIHIQNARFKEDSSPIENGCRCYTCRHYSRSYLRHLFMVKDPSATRLAAIHNLYFLESLMTEIRESIQKGRLTDLEREWGVRR
ncbi:MAG: tRNA guanosine(34) transglycosylase Tgt [Thermodesulfobacteriota bacterium]